MLINGVLFAFFLAALAFFFHGRFMVNRGAVAAEGLDMPAPTEPPPAPPVAEPVASVVAPAIVEDHHEPLDLDIAISLDDELPEVEIIELHHCDDVLTLEFAEEPNAHLHVVNGSASAAVDHGTAQSSWLDVYLSRAEWLDVQDLDSSGEYPPGLATHVIRIDLGSSLTRSDGTVTGKINDNPEIFFDREVASETEFTV
ncbi:hypothetical protein [Pelagovum pacificum]|uniref:Uncharacterized protein n=1 Tax=Pelagovum pacificum TaxID=2588711 RepID=A0A5C5G8V9_9RHOB|nr:hypothetical protein [Pelagovum pacificum]QQA42073.1 hypothetical protein I8N54_14920 [Pelagovum pacificum]TNY31161.1 hypothetical protein FHY64_14105 [Pelagovum pacificum]